MTGCGRAYYRNGYYGGYDPNSYEASILKCEASVGQDNVPEAICMRGKTYYRYREFQWYQRYADAADMWQPINSPKFATRENAAEVAAVLDWVDAQTMKKYPRVRPPQADAPHKKHLATPKQQKQQKAKRQAQPSKQQPKPNPSYKLTPPQCPECPKCRNHQV